MDYLLHNKKAWNKLVESKNRWTIPVTLEEIESARKGQLKVLLTPWKYVPVGWFPEIKNLKILCLASGGGQQGPVFAAAGADVTVFDLSPNQLMQDKLTAEKYNLTLKTIEGDMADLSVFPNEYFNLIFHPVSNCFVPYILPVWNEAFRVLKKGGVLLAGFTNPILFLFDESDPTAEVNLSIKNKIPYSDTESLTDEQKELYKINGHPFEYGHTLEDQIGGQIKAGFIITGFYEDSIHQTDHPIAEFISTFIATRAVKL